MSTPVRFGRYLLDRRLAIGGMAEVFVGRIEGPEGFEKRVVIKRILPHLQEDQSYVQMFLDEARLAARFDHPNLVQVYELARISNQYCLAMEYIEGEDVAAILDECLRQRRKLPFGVVAYIIAGAAEGLHYAHELTTDTGEPLNVVHRDISPANVIVTWRGGVKIVDFGIAKHEIATSKTVAGTLKGKFSYMSPEQARGEKVDRRSDLFSLGTILYEMLTVSPCFNGSNQIDILDAVTRVRYRPLRELRPDVPSSLERILKRMLVAKREDRYQSAEALLRDLKTLAAEHDFPSSNEVGAYLESVFGRRKPGSAPVRIPTAIQSVDEVPVTDELSSPETIADSSVYQLLVDSQIKKLDSFESRSEEQPLFDIESRLLEPPKLQRRSTISRVADRLREPRYWPTTLVVLAVIMAVSALALAMVYRAAMGMPWRPDYILSEVLGEKLPPPTSEEDVGAGALQVMSEPPGAAVLVDGARIDGRTPVTIDNLALGMVHRVVVEMEGYEPASRELLLSDVVLQTVNIKLLRAGMGKANVEIEVTTSPSGAAIFIDGVDTKQVTPATVLVTSGSEHTITAAFEGYRAKEVKVVPEPGKRSAIEVPLTKVAASGTGLVDIDSEPNAEVSIDGRVVGKTPLKRLSLPSGPVVVRLYNSKLGLTKTIKLNVVAGETLQRRVEFGKGQVAFDVRPWADVYIGGKKVGTTPMPPLSLYEGSYAIKLINPDLAVEKVVQVTVRAGKLKKVTEKMR